MRKLVPPFIALLTLIAVVFSLDAQTTIHNPELPQTLTFQWKINANEVHPDWRNNKFSIHREEADLMILYGQYANLEEALDDVPEVPNGVAASELELVAFVNQYSIQPEQALALLDANFSASELEENKVTFSVHLGTYFTLLNNSEFPSYVNRLSFEVLQDRSIQYSSGEFKSEQEAYELMYNLKQDGFDNATIQPWVYGEQLASKDLEKLYEYFAFMEW